MKTLLLFCLFLYESCANETKLYKLPAIQVSDIPEFEDRIFGGSLVKDGDLPYMVLVLSKTNLNQISRCSGALFSENLVLTAAHCFFNVASPEHTIVVAGRANLTRYMNARIPLVWDKDVPLKKRFGVQERRGSHLRMHLNYSNITYAHDLAILRVNAPFELSETVQIRNISLSGKPIGLYCTISGWGETSSGAVKGYQLVSADDIPALSVGNGCLHKMTGGFYCLVKEKAGICKGDSGSPLVCEDQIWGVASHLSSLTDHPQCGDDYEEYYAGFFDEEDFFMEAVAAVESEVELPEVIPESLGKCSVIFINTLFLVTVLIFFMLL